MIPRGDLVYRHLTIYRVLEYWSGGVMEETPFFIASENSPWRRSESLKLFFLNHCQVAPILQYSITPVD
jgi:hypothetical protein